MISLLVNFTQKTEPVTKSIFFVRVFDVLFSSFVFYFVMFWWWSGWGLFTQAIGIFTALIEIELIKLALIKIVPPHPTITQSIMIKGRKMLTILIAAEVRDMCTPWTKLSVFQYPII